MNKTRVRLAALLLSLGEDGIRRTLKRLRCSNALIEEAAVLVREARRRDGSFLFGHEFELRHPADALCLEQHSHPAGRCPNSNSLFPPLAAVVAVAPKGRGCYSTILLSASGSSSLKLER